ncbi:phosphoadenosine phosphosulfate reductase family protein [Neptuniibacter sp. QD37_11]|uniref:phosphoadenosine phosphosulfate reductase domain-containing protein n=1 Tax=Neptuniibacter sp. QD37_11 TaxID=3398209 RepID=UPI0039F54D40
MTNAMSGDLFGSAEPIAAIDITMELPDGFRQDDDIDTKIATLKAKIKEYLANGWALFQAYSGGKDSSVQLALTMEALKEYISEHGRDNCPVLSVIHSNTLLENPEIDKHTLAEIQRIRDYAAANNLPVEVDIAIPSMSENYIVNILGGRTIASVAATSSRKCAKMMKVEPLKRLKKKILKRLHNNYGEKVLTLVGKRYDESDARRADMIKYGEVPHQHITRGDEKVLSSIAHFTQDDIFWVIGMVRSEMLDTYSDFSSLVETYRAANGGECMVNALDGKAGSAGCGARYGCWICLQNATDKSMETMLEEDQFDYMRYLWAFRNYLQAYHNDPTKRSWLARKLEDDGSIKLQPNAYSPAFAEELLRMALSIQKLEDQRAASEGIPPRFQIISFEEVIAVQVLWARYGFNDCLQALRVWKDVVQDGQLTLPPLDQEQLPEFPLLNDFPDVSVPFADTSYDDEFNGLRDLQAAAAGIETVIEKSGGRQYMHVPTDVEFKVNHEELQTFLDLELDWALEQYNQPMYKPAAGLDYLFRLGVVSIYKGSHSDYDRMLKMGAQIRRHRLQDILHDPEAIVAQLGHADQTFKLGRLI